jgi:hypothetical protein
LSRQVTHKLASTTKRDFDQWVEAFSEVTTVDRQRERRSARLTPDMIPTRKTVTERSIKHQNMVRLDKPQSIENLEHCIFTP